MTSLSLTPPEQKALRDALVSAFPMPGSLEQVVFFGLGKALNTVVPQGPYLDVAFNLVRWANANGQVWQLLIEARAENPGNQELKAFHERVSVRFQRSTDDSGPEDGRVTAPPPDIHRLTTSLRQQLVSAITQISAFSDFSTRNLLLSGIQGATNLNRNPGNFRADITLIVDQLDVRGSTPSGDWQLLTFIRNALPFAEGLTAQTATLLSVMQTLEQDM